MFTGCNQGLCCGWDDLIESNLASTFSVDLLFRPAKQRDHHRAATSLLFWSRPHTHPHRRAVAQPAMHILHDARDDV